MGKLLGHKIKGHFSKNWFLIIAPIFITILSLVFSMINFIWMDFVYVLTFILIWACYCGAAICVIFEDYQMFYGDLAIFYQSMPISPNAKTFSRLLYYLIMFLIYSLVNGVCFIITIYSLIEVDLLEEFGSAQNAFNMFFEEISRTINQIGYTPIILIIIMALISLIYIITKIIFSITLGSEKKLKRFRLGGPIIVYMITSIIEIFIILFFVKTGLFSEDVFMYENFAFSINIGSSFMTLIISQVLKIILFLTVTIFETKNRLSIS